MAKLKNISSVDKYVGGWQGFQDPPGHVIRVKLSPGGEVTIPDEVIHHPTVKALAETADFKLTDVSLIAGGPVEADPALRTGKMRLLRKTVASTDFAGIAETTLEIGLGALPKGTVITSVVLRLATKFNDGAGNGVTVQLGSTADPNAVLVAQNLGVTAARLIPPTLLTNADTVDAGIDLKALITAAANDVEDQTAGSVEILIQYFVA